ncbi:uncharacterized protein [Branchiostoma lanceolatum]|uniref:uncharacterized protein n=1 Tax=Branchiostoma lanceolatum TaxID=7740 RepID=UPI0034514707
MYSSSGADTCGLSTFRHVPDTDCGSQGTTDISIHYGVTLQFCADACCAASSCLSFQYNTGSSCYLKTKLCSDEEKTHIAGGNMYDRSAGQGEIPGTTAAFTTSTTRSPPTTLSPSTATTPAHEHESRGYTSLGCWKDTNDRALTMLEGSDPRLDGKYGERQNAIDKCYQVALSRGFTVFAVQHSGQCFGSADANTYNKHGPSTGCAADGEGGRSANEVYQITADGNWSQWSSWSDCDVTCGFGNQSRSRSCDNPRPLGGGANCTGDSEQTQVCDTGQQCPVDGNWSPWTFWSSCDVTCGFGHQSRSRSCDNPRPLGGGANCTGNSEETQVCDTGQQCPVDGNWSPWTFWSSCDVTCGFGNQSRSRSCDNPRPLGGGANCTGNSEETQVCDTGQQCPVNGNWSEWTSWSSCNVTCGLGNHSRSRSCDNPSPQHGGVNCSGSLEEVRTCDSGRPCAVNGNWSQWTSWSNCDVTCGLGNQSRSRSCDNPPPQHGGANCTGSLVEVRTCDSGQPCTINGNWSEWTSWSSCNVTCGLGNQSRSRSCDNPPPQHGGANCTGSLVEVRTCDSGRPCAVNGNWSEWTSWSTCNVTCGLGNQSRSRSCDNPPPQHDGANCTGSLEEVRTCDSGQPCAINGNWSEWTSWSSCNVTCGLGNQSRSRSCDNPPPQHGGANCTGSLEEVRTCDSGRACAVNGNWSEWTSWSTCNVTCGLGNQSRSRSCDNPPPQHGGANCTGSPTEARACDSGQPCIVDGSWSEWSSWSTCNVSCGVGYKTRNRSCDNPAPLYGGANCTGTLQDEKSCDFLPPCAVDGGWSPWTFWSNCTETCGNGTRTRSRSCDHPLPQHGGANCTGDANQTQACGQDQTCYVPSVTSNAKPDLVDNGTVTDSTIAVTFSDQMFSLGLGLITHFTVIVAEDVTGLNDSMETGPVQNAQMYSWYDVQGLSPVPPYQVSSLAPYPFTSSLRKKRSAESQDISFTIGGENCTDPNVTLYCNGPLKPATTYRAKMRVFTPNGYFADSYYSAAISTLAYSWSDWTQWSVCTVSCGAGNQTRHRTCTTAPGNNGTGSVANCTGDSLQTRACLDIGPCPVDGVWSPWSVWSTCITTCGLGNQTRNRTCSQPLYGGANCTGNREEIRTCTGPLEPHCTSTAGPTVAQTTPSPDPLAPSDGGTMEEFTRWETGEALPETYDAQESPVDMSKGEPLQTSSGVKLESIGWLSEKTMDFNITATFTVAWTDKRLASLGGSGWIPVPSHVLWLPSVQFGRTVKARWSVTTSSEMTSVGREDNGPESGTVSTWLSPEGQISHKLKKKLRVSCLMDLRNYPFDRQTCSIKLHGYGGIAFQVFVTEGGRAPLVVDLTDMDSQFVVAKTELLATAGSFRREGKGCPYFHQKCDLGAEADYCPTLRFCDVSEPECRKCSMYSGACQVIPTTCNGSQSGSPADTFSTLEARIHFKRRLPYYILRVYTPTATVVAVSWMSFWVHYSETSARVALGCTTFLMLIRLGGQIEKMPHISYIRAIDLWYVFCLAFAFMVILEYAVVHHLHNPQNKKAKQIKQKGAKTGTNITRHREKQSTVVRPGKRVGKVVNQVRARQVSAGRNRVRPSADSKSDRPVRVQSSGWDLVIPSTSKNIYKTLQHKDDAIQKNDNKDTLEGQPIAVPPRKQRIARLVNLVQARQASVDRNNDKSARRDLIVPATSKHRSKTSQRQDSKDTPEGQAIVIPPRKRFTKTVNQVRSTVKEANTKPVRAHPSGWGLIIPPTSKLTSKAPQHQEDNDKNVTPEEQPIVIPPNKRFLKTATQVRSTVQEANSKQPSSGWGLIIQPTSKLTSKTPQHQEDNDKNVTPEEQPIVIPPSKRFLKTAKQVRSTVQETNSKQPSSGWGLIIPPTSRVTSKASQFQGGNTREDQSAVIPTSKHFAKTTNQVRSIDKEANSKSIRMEASGLGLIIPPSSKLTSKTSQYQDIADQEGDDKGTLVKDANTTSRVMGGQTTVKRRRDRGMQEKLARGSSVAAPFSQQQIPHQAEEPTQGTPTNSSDICAPVLPVSDVVDEEPATTNKQEKSGKSEHVTYKRPCSIDVWSRVAFPVGFLLFSIVYWVYYLYS